MKKDINQNGWNEYSKLVLAELERLNENDEKIQHTLNEINLKLGKIDSIEKDVQDIEKWKKYMDDVASPNTLKDIKKDVKSFTTFKTVATTVWAVVQIAFGIFLAFYKK
jgi:hypothetical protein|tara:strand:+ start:1521 stop:1847 length:327 start_codon:yes stop_codon:yes gene_type:complete